MFVTEVVFTLIANEAIGIAENVKFVMEFPCFFQRDGRPNSCNLSVLPVVRQVQLKSPTSEGFTRMQIPRSSGI